MKSEMLSAAFAALAKNPSPEELELAADVIRADPEALAVIEQFGDAQVFDELADLADRAGSSGFVALNLCTVVAYGVEALTRRSRGNAGTAYSQRR